MTRYINADKLALHLSDYALQESPNWGANGHGNLDAYDAINECIKAIDEQPTADVVEVVRCKDCKYYNAIDTDRLSECEKGFETYGNDFCSYGERKNIKAQKVLAGGILGGRRRCCLNEWGYIQTQSFR